MARRSMWKAPPPSWPTRRCSRSATSSHAIHRYAIQACSRVDATFAIPGTGQTKIDLALALDRRGHKGRIVAISRRGLLPLAHRGFESYPSFFKEMEGSTNLLNIFRVVRKHLARAESNGIDARSVIDSLRP